MKPSGNLRLIFWGLLSLYFLFLGYQILHSDYLFTDEAHMLWYQADHHSVFTYFHKQGRGLTGWLEQALFETCGKTENVKYIRLLSLGECILVLIFLFYMLKALQRSDEIRIDDPLIYLTVAFVAASLSTTICIGWAVCTEVFIPILISLGAGWILYAGGPRRGWLVLPLGVIALFFYQSPYPFLLLPFYLVFLTRKDGRFMTRPINIGLFFYFAGLAIYFILFKYSLKVSGMTASNRTDLAFKPLDRLSFFFSFPLNQAFNGNFFFETRSIVSQAVFPLLFLAWTLRTFYSRRGRTLDNIRYLLGMLLFWILGYLPLLIAQESFGPYRTMLVLSVLVFLMLADAVLPMIRSLRVRTVVSFTLIALLLVNGAFHYKVYITDPLNKEYRSIKAAVRKGYTDQVREVVFLRPADNGFEASLGIGSYKDEFGLPSTNKDWTPEPLVKQLVFELTGDRRRAAALKITQYASLDEWKAAGGDKQFSPEQWKVNSVWRRDSLLYINAPKLLNDLK